MALQLDKRVILHIDVDCFYAQVEESRRPELKGRPLGIFQKFLVVTCNYPARNAGVAKMCSKEDALRVCPDLVLVNGEDLTPYRAVSKRILQVMRRFGIVERRGMDEAYLDVTEEVRKRMSLAVGPSPVYRGFVGKVLAGPHEKLVAVAGQLEQNPGPSSQVKLGGEPLEDQKSRISQAELSQTLGSGGDLLVESEQAAQQGATIAGSRSETALESGGCEKERKASLTDFEEPSRKPVVGPELVGRFVPPGWRPLMRPRAVDDVSKTWGSGATSSGITEPMETTSGTTNPAVKTLTSDGVSTNMEGLETDLTGSDRKHSFHNPNPVPSAAKSLGSRYPGFLSSEPPNSIPLVTSSSLFRRPQYGSLAEAFGGVLKRPGNALGDWSDSPEPGVKRARVETETEATEKHGKKLSWLDWRNETDPALPAGKSSPGHDPSSPGHHPSSPGHGTPGKSPSGKLPGHWSDVRQVRFQPAAPDGVLKTSEKLDFGADVAGSDWLLLVGSHVAAEVREAIWAEVGCRCSAGVAHNKMLAKLASPMNKPNGQTTMLTGAVAGHIQYLPARKIPGIGWSYDAKLREMKIDTIGDLQKVALTELEEKFGARVGGMIYQCCKGEDSSVVEDKGPPKSLSVEDSFRACLNLKQAEGIVKALAADYIDRLDEEREDTGRRPKTLTVRWRQKGASYQGQSTSGPMPQDITAPNLPKPRREEALVRSAMALLSKAFAGKKFHLVKLNVGATNLVEEPAKGTPSLLRSWVEKGTGNGKGPESDSIEMGGGLRAEQSVTAGDLCGALEGGLVGGTESERNVSGMVSRGTELQVNVDSGESLEELSGIEPVGTERSGTERSGNVRSGAETSGTEQSGMEKSGTERSGTGVCRTEPSSIGRDLTQSGEEVPVTNAGNRTNIHSGRIGATNHDRNGSFGPELDHPGPSQITRAAGTSDDETLRSAQAPSGWAGVSPGKGLGVLGAVAGSVLHANTGSKKEARAMREAIEGVKPVLGNGHEKLTASWQRFAEPGGLSGHLGAGSGDLDLYGLDPVFLGGDCDGKPKAGFVNKKNNPGDDSDENEDLWDDLQSVRSERRGFRSNGPERLWGSDGRSETFGNGQSDLVHPSAHRGDNRNGQASGLSPSQIRPKTDPKQRYPLGDREAEPVMVEDASKGVGLVARELEQIYGDDGIFFKKCSTCGEVLAEDSLVRREHEDRHVAARLQKEEDKLGALFKKFSHPLEKRPRGVETHRNGVTIKRGVKSGVGTLEKFLKR